MKVLRDFLTVGLYDDDYARFSLVSPFAFAGDLSLETPVAELLRISLLTAADIEYLVFSWSSFSRLFWTSYARGLNAVSKATCDGAVCLAVEANCRLPGLDCSPDCKSVFLGELTLRFGRVLV